MTPSDHLKSINSEIHKEIYHGFLDRADSLNNILSELSIKENNSYYEHMANIHKMRIIFNRGVDQDYPVDLTYIERNHVKEPGILFYYYYTLSHFYVFKPVLCLKYFDKAINTPEIKNNDELKELKRFVILYKFCFYTYTEEYIPESYEGTKDEIIYKLFKEIRSDFNEYPAYLKGLYYCYKFYHTYNLGHLQVLVQNAYLDSLEQTVKNTDNVRGQMDYHYCLGLRYSDNEDFGRELVHRKKIDSLSKITQLGSYPFNNFIKMSQCYMNLKEYDSALVNLQKSLPWLHSNLLKQNNNILLLSEVHEKLGNLDSAELYLVKYYNYNDSIKNQYLIELSQYINDDIQHNIQKEKLAVTSKANYYSNLSLSFLSLFLVFLVSYLFTYRNQVELKKKSLIINSNNEKISTLVQLVSHDLKTPFNSIQFLANEILDEESKKTEKDVNLEMYLYKTSDKIQEKLTYLSFLFDPYENIPFDFTKETISLEECINESTVYQQTKNSWVDVNSVLQKNYPPEANLYVNKSLFVVVLQNLIDNAIQYSKPNQKPLIEIQSERINNKQLITLTDYGIGIKKEYLSVIFDKGISWATKQNKSANSGVGLYVCKRIVEEFHKGSITCFSQEGSHTSFVISLPTK